MRFLCVFLLSLMLLIPVSSSEAQRFGGRGGGGFGGGARGGGGGFSRGPSMSLAMPSRPAASRPTVNRPAPATRPSTARTSPTGPSVASRAQTRPGNVRPSAGNLSGSRTSAAGTSGRTTGGSARGNLGNPMAGARSNFQQPSRNQLDSFLSGEQATGAVRGNPLANPSGAPGNRNGGSSGRDLNGLVDPGPSVGDGGNSRTWETAGGGSITIGGTGKGGTTQGGANVGAGVGGIKIETGSGNTFTKGGVVAGGSQGDSVAGVAGGRTSVETAGGGSGSVGRGVAGVSDGERGAVVGSRRGRVETAAGGSAVGGRDLAAVTDGNNSAVAGRGGVAANDGSGNRFAAGRAGYADSSGYREGAGFNASQNQWGYTRINTASGFGTNGTGRRSYQHTVIGPGGNAISTGRGASFINGQFVGGRSYTAINANFNRWNYFGPGYYNRYPGAWFPGKWAIIGTAWSTATWATAGAYCGCVGDGVYYDYGDSVVYQDGSVLYDGEVVASEGEYYEQANAIAQTGQAPENEEWMPLGVFALITEPDQDHSDKLLQLAVNRNGEIAGNYQDLLTDEVTPVFGAVDKATQRVAIRLEGNDSLVMEVGLYNLTNDEVPVLIHQGSDQRQARTLIRLVPPEEQGEESENGDDQ